jgi:hypothetical protein
MNGLPPLWLGTDSDRRPVAPETRTTANPP